MTGIYHQFPSTTICFGYFKLIVLVLQLAKFCISLTVLAQLALTR